MRIQLRSDSTYGVLPAAYRYLASAPPVPEGRRKAYRPPLAIYNLSLSRVLDALEDVATAVAKAHKQRIIPQAGGGLEWLESVVSKHQECLDALQAHLDDCNKLSEGACSVAGAGGAKARQRYKIRTKEYRDRISRITGHVKHHHGRLRAFAFYTSSLCYPGYYVEGVGADNLVGPEPTVHKGGAGAFSFARDLRLHFVWVYLVSEFLAEVLSVSTNKTPKTLSHPSDAKYVSLAQTLESIPLRFFPDECTLPIPMVEVVWHGRRGPSDLNISYAQDLIAPKVRRGPNLRIATSWRSDGVNRQWRLPYDALDSPDNIVEIAPPKR